MLMHLRVEGAAKLLLGSCSFGVWGFTLAMTRTWVSHLGLCASGFEVSLGLALAISQAMTARFNQRALTRRHRLPVVLLLA